MSKTKLISILLWPVVIYLGYLLYDSINSKIELTKAIERSEAQVIDRLKQVREAEKAFKDVNGYYTSDWDSLVTFVQSDSLPIVEKIEKITPRRRDDPDYYKGDIIEVTYDTIGREPVLEKIFPEEDYPNFDPAKMPFVPNMSQKEKFDIFTDRIDRGGVMVDVIEVVDRHPMDKTRSDEQQSRVRWFLRFGSRTEPRLNGNWE